MSQDPAWTKCYLIECDFVYPCPLDVLAEIALAMTVLSGVFIPENRGGNPPPDRLDSA
jgi:hypothetical protein